MNSQVAPLPLQEATLEIDPIEQEAVEETAPPPQQQLPSGLGNYHLVLRNEFERLQGDNAEMRRSQEVMRRDIENFGERNEMDELNEVVEETTPQQQRPSGLGNYMSFAGRLLGVGSVSPRTDLNTGTINLFAVAVVVDPSARRRSKWLAAVGILVIVLLEVFVFSVVVYESSHPKCNAVSDCPAGNYCQVENRGGYFSRECEDCELLQHFHLFSNSADFEETCSSVLPADKWEHRAFIDADYSASQLDNKNSFDHELYKCLVYNHCNESDMDADTDFIGHCDFIASNVAKLDTQVWILIIFLAFLWTLPICQDIEEATIEEAVMDHQLADSFNGPAEILRVTFRIRRYIIPLCTTSADRRHFFKKYYSQLSCHQSCFRGR